MRHSQAVKAKISKALKGNVPWIKGKKHSAEAKKKISEALTGKQYSTRFTHEQAFTVNGTLTTQKLKARILKEELLPYICVECQNTGIHNGKKLTLQLDHINGINNDNRLENLRFLCPNCHSQTNNYAGKNIKKIRV